MTQRCARMGLWGLTFSVLLFSLFSLPLSAHADTLLRICEDDNYAPFVYKANGQTEVQGVTPALVARVFSRLGLRYRIDMLPWARCLAYVRDGSYQIGLDAYHNPARERDYVFSHPYATLTPQYYYSRRRFPDGLHIQRAEDLKKYQGCGILGYSYHHYGLSALEIDQTAQDHAALIRKAKFERCAFFVEELEVMRGYALIGQRFLADADLGHAAVPGVVAPQLHFILSRRDKQLQRWLPAINQQIDLAQRDGFVRARMQHLLSAAAAS